jgi:hypothetical protein
MRGRAAAWRDAVSFALDFFFIGNLFFNQQFQKSKNAVRFFSGHLLRRLEAGAG